MQFGPLAPMWVADLLRKGIVSSVLGVEFFAVQKELGANSVLQWCAYLSTDSALELRFHNTWQNSVLRNSCTYLTLLSGLCWHCHLETVGFCIVCKVVVGLFACCFYACLITSKERKLKYPFKEARWEGRLQCHHPGCCWAEENGLGKSHWPGEAQQSTKYHYLLKYPLFGFQTLWLSCPR